MTNKRIAKIVRILLAQTDYITIDKIAAQLEVSNKTIRNDLILVNDWLKDYNVCLEKKIGVGIAITGEEDTKLKILDHINQKNTQTEEYSPQGRYYYIIKRLLDSSDYQRISELAKELYVSRATIAKDLQVVSNFLAPNKVTLIRDSNHGIKLEGSEKNLRKVLSNIILADNGVEIRKLLQNKQPEISNDILINVYDLFDSDLLELKTILYDISDFQIDLIPENMLLNVFIKILTTILRLQQNCTITLSDEFIEELKAKEYYEVSKSICMRLAEEYELIFSEYEIRYIQVYLISAYLNKEKSYEHNAEAAMLTKQLIHQWELLLDVTFSSDQELYDALLLHLDPAITRFKHSISINNPLLDEIKTQYKRTYEVVSESFARINQDGTYQISETEMGFITLHLAAAIDRAKKPLAVIVVCNGGVGETTLVANKLRRFVHFIEIVGTDNLASIYHRDLHGIDLILTTVPLEPVDQNIPVLIINSILHTYDLKRIDEIVLELFRKKNELLIHLER